MTTKIITSNGSGRPVNPFIKFIGDPDNFQKFNEFEEKIVDLPTFLNNQPFMDSYEGEAELVWQYQHTNGILKGQWADFLEQSEHAFFNKSNAPTRQIWRILPSAAAVNLASGEQREKQYWDDFDERFKNLHEGVHQLVTKYGWKDFYFAAKQYNEKVTKSAYKIPTL